MKLTNAELPQDYARLRADAYPSGGEQLGAMIKALEAVLPHLPPEAVAAIPADAMQVIEQVAAVKTAIPNPNAEMTDGD